MKKTSIRIDGIPIVSSDEYLADLDPNQCTIGSGFMIRPKWEYLPNFGELEEDEKDDYELKNIPEGFYLMGMELISNGWVNLGFCGTLFNSYGLVLEESYPMVTKNDKYEVESPYVLLRFTHVFNEMHGDIKAKLTL